MSNRRLQHFTHWHFIHVTPAAWEVQMLHPVNTKKCSFHSSNVKPGCTRNIHVLSLLLHWTSGNFSVRITIHINSIPFSMQMAHGVPAGFPAGLNPSHACLTAATRQISQLPPMTSLGAFPVRSWKAPASALVSQSYLRTPKAEALPCKTTPVKMSLLLHLDESTGTQRRWTEWGDGEPWWVRPGPTLLSGAAPDQLTPCTKASQGEEPASSADNILLLIHPCSWEHCWAHTPWQAQGEKLWKPLGSARDPISWHNTKIKKSKSLTFL